MTQRITQLKRVPAEWPTQGNSRIALVGEAPGTEEAREGRPFVGASGHMMNQLLRMAGIDRASCLVTNVFKNKPINNEVGRFFLSKSQLSSPPDPEFYHSTHGYVDDKYKQDIAELWNDLRAFDPNVIIAVGGTAAWALTGDNRITKSRGMVVRATNTRDNGEPFKVLPTYHPAYVMRGNWHLRNTVGMDLLKAKREADWPEVRSIKRRVLIEPELSDLERFEKDILPGAEVISYDIETEPWTLKQIRCVGFAVSTGEAIVIPFTDSRKRDGSYWSSLSDELRAWEYVRSWLGDPRTRKLAQNGLYDISWLYRVGVRVRGPIEDTMVLHHALEPELPKDLGTLVSMYTDETLAWKGMANFKKGNKKDA